MKRLMTMLLLCGSLLPALLADGITFTEIRTEAEWNAALQKAFKNKQNIYIDVYATWCGPCKMMDKQTFSDPDVASYFDDTYLNLKVDGEIMIGELIMQEYGITAYPYGLFLEVAEKPEEGSSNWPNVLNSAEGFVAAAQFLDMGKSTATMEEQLGGWRKGAAAGTLGLSGTYDYVMHLKKTGQEDEAGSIAISYLKDQDMDGLMPYQAWEMVKSFVKDMNDPLTEKVLAHHDDFVYMRGSDEVNSHLLEILQQSMFINTMKKDEAGLEKTLSTILPLIQKSEDESKVMEIDLVARQSFYEMHEMYPQYIAATDKYIQAYAANDEGFHFELAKKVWQEENPALYEAGERWAETAIALEDDFGNNFVYMGILLSNNKQDEAKKVYDKLSEQDLDADQLQYMMQIREEFD